MYGKADWISTASGSERASGYAALATARGTDPYCNLSMPYIDLQSAIAIYGFYRLQRRETRRDDFPSLTEYRSGLPKRSRAIRLSNSLITWRQRRGMFIERLLYLPAGVINIALLRIRQEARSLSLPAVSQAPALQRLHRSDLCASFKYFTQALPACIGYLNPVCYKA